MVAADLHVHTTNSDGTLALREVPEIAREAGLAAVAITDHDRLHPEIDAPILRVPGDADDPIEDAVPVTADLAAGSADAPGSRANDGGAGGSGASDGDPDGDLALIHGVELRVDAGDQRLDLLGYGARPTDALTAEIDRLQRDRIERGRAIVERVEDRLGVSLPIEPERGIGRPDIARAVVDSDADYGDVGAVFDDLIGNDRPCYVAREVPSFEDGAEILREACGVVGLAHPLRYPDPESALDRAAALDAVELHYPYGEDVDRGLVADAAERHDLLVTGGSDAHDRALGVAGLSEGDYRRFAGALDR